MPAAKNPSSTPFPFSLSADGTMWCCGMAGCTKQIEVSKKSGIAYHKNTHDPKYKCEDCGKLFAQKFQLDVHVRAAHTGEKPYQCSCCERAFPQLANLQDHVKKNHAGAAIPMTADSFVSPLKPVTRKEAATSTSDLRPSDELEAEDPQPTISTTEDKAWDELMQEIDGILKTEPSKAKVVHAH